MVPLAAWGKEPLAVQVRPNLLSTLPYSVTVVVGNTYTPLLVSIIMVTG